VNWSANAGNRVLIPGFDSQTGCDHGGAAVAQVGESVMMAATMHVGRIRVRHALLDAGGVTELAGGGAGRKHWNPHRQMIQPWRGGGTFRRRVPLPLPGRVLFGLPIRWFSLAALALLPANFLYPIGTPSKPPPKP
jgi:hypothetical protein